MKKILARSIIYFCLTVAISIVAIRHADDEFAVKMFSIILLLLLYIISFYDISIKGDEHIKTLEPSLYNELINQRRTYDLKPIFGASYLILSGRCRFYPKLKLIIIATMFYYLLVIILMITVFIILT